MTPKRFLIGMGIILIIFIAWGLINGEFHGGTTGQSWHPFGG